ncbi:MAG: DUF2948 family protein [Rhodobacteraceae bacterium]|nr:DUF2948 family protein [Paracoccaceae bacterium]
MTILDERFPSFEEMPLKLIATDRQDLDVVSALLQDALFARLDLTYSESHREMAILLNRFRWEMMPDAAPRRQKPERVRAVFLIRDVMALESNLPARTVNTMPFSVLAIEFMPNEGCEGCLHIKLAGNWDIRATVECINLTLTDVTVPYAAPSGRIPAHHDR